MRRSLRSIRSARFSRLSAFLAWVHLVRFRLGADGGPVLLRDRTALRVLSALAALIDARRDNSPASGEITPPKTLLHICQQNYKMKGEGISPALSV